VTEHRSEWSLKDLDGDVLLTIRRFRLYTTQKIEIQLSAFEFTPGQAREIGRQLVAMGESASDYDEVAKK